MKPLLLSITFIILTLHSHADDSLRVLFIGNSYTSFQELPLMVKNLANDQGHDIAFQMVAPGGYKLEDHWTNIGTLNQIAAGGWDYVVLQEQSQLPAFPEGAVQQHFYPFVQQLDSLIHEHTPCAKTVLYMTWGRENGDVQNCAVWPPVCTYEGMDSLLRLRYAHAAELNHTLISPAGPLFRYTRQHAPPITLYQTDGSHPSLSGTYLVALGFYTLFFGEDPTNNDYNSGLPVNEAQTLKNMAKTVAYDSLAYWQRFADILRVDSILVDGNGSTFTFSALNPQHVIGYAWDFGDGSPVSYEQSPTHTYAPGDTYTVCLTVFSGYDTLTICLDIASGNTGIEKPRFPQVTLAPNPAGSTLNVSGLTGAVDYQIIDVSGRVWKSGSLPAGNPPLNVQLLAPGWYQLLMKNLSGAAYRAGFIKR